MYHSTELLLACIEPLRPSGSWWVLATEHDDDAWVCSDLDACKVNSLVHFILELSSFDGIDQDKVALMGFSNGAYACTEVLATGRLGGLSCCCLGGLHGNGSPDPKADGITGKHHEHFIVIMSPTTNERQGRSIEGT